ncbi:MAG: hypothetical protein HY067_09590 [Betaproteobacteria bacterium]|nr:hypothetical protein [Betaproteobacteria bacterium]
MTESSTQKPIRDCFKDYETFNAAAIAINNAAGILAAAGVAKIDVGDWALEEAINLINDVLMAMNFEVDNEVFDYLNRAAAISDLVRDVGSEMGDKNRTQALYAAESLLQFVNVVHFCQSVVTSDFARLRNPKLFEEGTALQELLESAAPSSRRSAEQLLKTLRETKGDSTQ